MNLTKPVVSRIRDELSSAGSVYAGRPCCHRAYRWLPSLVARGYGIRRSVDNCRALRHCSGFGTRVGPADEHDKSVDLDPPDTLRRRSFRPACGHARGSVFADKRSRPTTSSQMGHLHKQPCNRRCRCRACCLVLSNGVEWRHRRNGCRDSCRSDRCGSSRCRFRGGSRQGARYPESMGPCSEPWRL